MLVAVIYNEVKDPHEVVDPPSRTLQTEALGFEPCFDLEETSTEEDIAEIVQALEAEGMEVFSYNLQDRFEDLIRALTQQRPDVVFNLVEARWDAPFLEMIAAGIYEIMDIRYTGSTPSTLGLCQRKNVTKRILLAHGIPTPRFKTVMKNDTSFQHRLHYPLVVKPAREDGSQGVDDESVVVDLLSLKQRVRYILDEFQQPAMLEEFIDGRELNVSILGLEEPVVLPISEVDFSKLPKSANTIFTYQAKWEPIHEVYHRTPSICPAPLSKRLEKEVREIALRAYQVMGCRDYARIDLRLDKQKRPFVLEVNPNPHLSEGMGFMRSAESGGLSFGQTLKKIVELAWNRGRFEEKDPGRNPGQRGCDAR